MVATIEDMGIGGNRIMTIRMQRGDRFADIHPDMVEACAAVGWVRVADARETRAVAPPPKPASILPRRARNDLQRRLGIETAADLLRVASERNGIERLLDAWGIHADNIDEVLARAKDGVL